MSSRRITILSCSVLLAITGIPVAQSGDYKLPDTGITKCYDNSSEIACPAPGEAFYGQDAQYHGPQPAYRDNGDGTVTDLNTGLEWQKADNGVYLTWQAAIDHCSSISYPGKTDWRLPDRRELMSILDYGRFDPAIHPVFSCRSEFFWSGSTYEYNADDAWMVEFDGGQVTWYRKTWPCNVRCVREGP